MIAWLTVPGQTEADWKEVKKRCPKEHKALMEKCKEAGGKDMQDACMIFLAIGPYLKLDANGQPLMGPWTKAWQFQAAFCELATKYEEATTKPLFINMPLVGVKPIAPK